MIKEKRIGIVVSNKPDKTIIVTVQTMYSHPKYVKTLITAKRYMAHDERNICKEGDLVLIEESAPISRHKTWKLKKVLNFSKKLLIKKK